MKVVSIVALLLLAGYITNAQSSAIADSLAHKIARKMKDSLGLSDAQRLDLHQVNLQINETKMSKRQQYSGMDSLRIHIQGVENTRDSLYRPILGEEKYQLYLQKKRNLVNNN